MFHHAGVVEAVYPRACGGTGLLDELAPGTVGLSPRVRGNPAGTNAFHNYLRSIPARAGEPLTK